MKLSQRDRRALWIGGLAGGVILLVFFVILPFVEGQRRIKDDLANRRVRLERALINISEKEERMARLEALKQRLARLENQLFDGSNPAALAAELQELVASMAAQNGVEIVSKEPMREQKRLGETRYQKVSLRVETSATPEQLVRLLVALRNHPRYLAVEEMQIYIYGGFRQQQPEAKLRPNLVISTYVKAPPEKKEGVKAAEKRRLIWREG